MNRSSTPTASPERLEELERAQNLRLSSMQRGLVKRTQLLDVTRSNSIFGGAATTRKISLMKG